MSGSIERPRADPSPDTQPYWDGLARGVVLIQKCTDCGRHRHYPRPMCDGCFSFAHDWVEASADVTVHSWTVTHHAFNPGFKGELPMILVTVDLPEGVRMNAPLRGIDATALKIGLPVKVIFEPAIEGLTLPAFVRA